MEKDFHKAMLNIYEEGLRLPKPYRATRYRQMVCELGGKKAAEKLLSTSDPSEGFTQLFLHGQNDGLKKSVEYLVLQKPWSALFTDEQLSVARDRLKKYDCPVPE
jgi:hypothetical protein